MNDHLRSFTVKYISLLKLLTYLIIVLRWPAINHAQFRFQMLPYSFQKLVELFVAHR